MTVTISNPEDVVLVKYNITNFKVSGSMWLVCICVNFQLNCLNKINDESYFVHQSVFVIVCCTIYISENHLHYIQLDSILYTV
jgi:hypothetical protein